TSTFSGASRTSARPPGGGCSSTTRSAPTIPSAISRPPRSASNTRKVLLLRCVLDGEAYDGEARGVQGMVSDIRRHYEGVAARPIARSGYHRWMFDEESFVDVMEGLRRVGLSPFRVEACYNTVADTMSFNAVLSL